MIIPWWAKVVQVEVMVISWPPPVPVEVNTLATLPLDGHLGALDAASAFGDGVGHGFDVAIHGVIKHENLCHPVVPLVDIRLLGR